MKHFGFGILTGFGGTLAGILGIFLAIYVIAPDRFPAPAMSPIAQIDEKLSFIRNNPEIDPRILAVGSSITFRQLAGHEFRNVAGGRKHFLNGGVVQVQVDETQDLADFYLDNYPNVETVLMLTGLPDFQDCSSDDPPMLDADSARGYTFEHYPSFLYYLRYFSPQRYVRGAMELRQRRTPFYGDLYIDEYGSGPVKIPKGASYGLRYGQIRVDPACVTAMSDFAQDVTDRGKRMVIVFAPVNPKYREVFRDSTSQIADIIAQVRRGIAGKKASVIDLHDSPQFEASDFYDAFHLLWPGTKHLSVLLAKDLERLKTNKAVGSAGEQAVIVTKGAAPVVPVVADHSANGGSAARNGPHLE